MNIESYGKSHMKKNNNIAIIALLISFICLWSVHFFDINDKAPVTPTSSPVLITSSPIQREENIKEYTFRNEKLLKSHYEKHGIEMGFSTEEEYQTAASLVVNNPKVLHKKEKEDNDDVYYLEETNEFVIISTDGYIRTYFNPNSGIEYYNRQ